MSTEWLKEETDSRTGVVNNPDTSDKLKTLLYSGVDNSNKANEFIEI